MSATLPLRGAHVLVTGGGTGIGSAVARKLFDMGAQITVFGRRREPLESLVRELGSGAAVSCDVTSESTVEAAFAAAIERQGAVTVLVNNAGAAESAPLARSDEALFKRMLDVNLMGAVYCSRQFLAQRPLPPRARIVNVASTAGLTGYPYVSAYCAAKHALVGLTRALAREWARADVTINAVCPGFTQTDLLDASIEKIAAVSGRAPEELRAQMAQHNPQGRLIEAHEVAASVAWLTLPDSGSITGQAIVIAGGEVM